MSSRRTITTTLEIEVEIEYDFTSGSPETGPSYPSGGEPAEPAELSICKVTILSPLACKTLEDVAEGWLQDEGYAEASEDEPYEGPEDEG